MKRALLLLALAATLALPFALRPRQGLTTRTDDTLVIITPHNEAIRHEFGLAFARWYQARTGRTVGVDWRVIGGTTEIAQFLEGAYDASFQRRWSGQMGRPWSAEVKAGFVNPKLAADAPEAARDARAAFLASDAGCGLDVFFGGGAYDFSKQALAGRLVDSGLVQSHPAWFGDDVIPLTFAGEPFRDKNGAWFGCVLSSFGIISNRDVWSRLGLGQAPQQWADLTDPRLVGQVALTDPTRSSSSAAAFECVLQQQIEQRLLALQAANPGADARALETQAVSEGWLAGLRLLQLVAANARYFTDSSQKVPIDVAAGDCAAGICIDFLARQQQEATRRRGGSDRIAYVSPAGGTVASADPVALFRGAPHRAVAVAFMEFVLTPEGQKLWNLQPGAPGGPETYALRRLPVRKDFYTDAALTPLRSDPDDSPYVAANTLVYHPEWTGGLFREMTFVIRVMAIDPHPELQAAWRDIIAAGRPANALAALQDLSAVDYAAASGRIKAALASPDRVQEAQLAAELGTAFRAQYQRAAGLARARQ